MEFEWDEAKEELNLRKHGIDFATAALAFADPQLLVREDRVDGTHELRWHAIGLAAGLEPLLLVVHVYREDPDGQEIIRIISARKATSRESREYFQ